MQDFPFIPSQWLQFVPALQAGKHLPFFEKIASWRQEGKIIYPAQNNIFRALQYTPPEEIRVIIVGQDPYHGPNQAHGLAFSVQENQPAPPSLRNIFKEIAQNTFTTSSTVSTPPTGASGISSAHTHAPAALCAHASTVNPNLERWATQGVLLLNSILSVEEGKPLSHAKFGWQHITQDILQALASNTFDEGKTRPIAVLLWGNAARTHAELFRQSGAHLVLEAAHPSPLSASRGFFGCGHFSTVNAWLTAQGHNPIIW